MGRGIPAQPKRLPEKLRAIRNYLGLSQREMARRLITAGAEMSENYVGLYEINERTPTILVLLVYSRLAQVSMETLADDKMDLPRKFNCL